jgi:hypothetical protein
MADERVTYEWKGCKFAANCLCSGGPVSVMNLSAPMDHFIFHTLPRKRGLKFQFQSPGASGAAGP